MKNNEQRLDFMATTKALIMFSLPLIGSGILQQLYNWADAFVVGNFVGETALAAVGSTGTVINFWLMAITGFTLGLSILVGRKFGSGERDYIARLLSTFSLFLGVVAIVAMIVGIGFIHSLLVLLDTMPDAMTLAETYLKICFLGVPFLAVYNVYYAALRGIGDSRTPFLAIMISSVLNIVLNVLFVAYFKWGIAGAAIATVISQMGMTIFIICYAVKKHALLRFPWKGKLFHLDVFKEGLRFGFPPMIQSSVSAFGSLLLQNFMNGFGTQTVAAITTAYRVDTIVILPIINLGSGIATMVAQNHGAGNLKKAHNVLTAGLWLMILISLFLTALIIPFGGKVIALFGISPASIAIGHAFFQRLASFYVIYGLAMAMRGYLEGMGELRYSSFASISGLVVRIVASYGLVVYFDNMVIAYAEAIGWLALFSLFLGRLLVVNRKERVDIFF